MRGKPPDQAPPDAAADFEQVFRDAAPGLWRPIYAFAAGRSAVADDAVAEAFARALERADQIRDPVPWLYRTAFRLAAQDLRRGRRELGHVPRGFYLIHAPRAFYVIGRQFQGQAKPFAKCTLAFDRKTFQVYCPGIEP